MKEMLKGSLWWHHGREVLSHFEFFFPSLINSDHEFRQKRKIDARAMLGKELFLINSKSFVQKWQGTFLSIDCDKLGKKEKEDYFDMKCETPLFLCGEMSSKWFQLKFVLNSCQECPNSTSPLQEFLFGHYEEECFNATTEKQDGIKAQILGINFKNSKKKSTNF